MDSSHHGICVFWFVQLHLSATQPTHTHTYIHTLMNSWVKLSVLLARWTAVCEVKLPADVSWKKRKRALSESCSLMVIQVGDGFVQTTRERVLKTHHIYRVTYYLFMSYMMCSLHHHINTSENNSFSMCIWNILKIIRVKDLKFITNQLCFSSKGCITVSKHPI